MNRDDESLITVAGLVDQNNVTVGYNTLPPVINDAKAKQLPQYVAAVSATLCALAAGIVLGWTSPIVTEIENGKYHNISVDSSEMGWIGSLPTIGALLTCIPTGLLCDLMGRKTVLLLLLIPYTVGWSLIIFATNVYTLCLGRFITGIPVGACCVAAPMYTSEIGQKEIRGKLGSYFQLMVTAGVLYSYVFGAVTQLTTYTIICSVVPIVFALIFCFQPESPLYYVKQKRYDKARKALVHLRGARYNVDAELNEIDACVKNTESHHVGMLHAFSRKASKRALLISLTLMLIQQLSGINAIIFYTSDIFEKAGVTLDPHYATIIIGVFQVVATFVSSLIVDKLGRRVLLLISAFFMSVSLLLLGLYFALMEHKVVSAYVIEKLSFLPILSLILYIIMFSLGLGPIPWLVSSEIFSSEIKGISASLSGSFNWFLAFLVTKLYLQVAKKVGDDSTFIFFAIGLLFATVYIYYVVPETKGKSEAEIQEELNQ